ncbi:MAG: FAD-binding domain-containing protein, partial [Pseudomonadota bacterium]
MFHPATRAEALERLARFAPASGRAYAGSRNTDTGPGHRTNVSQLSPYIARRMITEAEAVEAALAHHSLSAAEKFVQEVLWRTYFKGWLEHRPTVWAGYREGMAEDLARTPETAWRKAAEGNTGIACFDAWAQELIETGYLHNHARMWFASIWIFTLRLPWRIGADFFLRHLIDGDAAANTLSWRWVAGLHTPGKNYVARSSNIARYTEGRFPETHGLAENPAPLDEGGLPPRQALRRPDALTGAPALYILTTEDLSPEIPERLDIRGAATLNLAEARSALPLGAPLEAFQEEALKDAARRLGTPHHTLAGESSEALIALAHSLGATEIVTAFRHQGWVEDWFEA